MSGTNSTAVLFFRGIRSLVERPLRALGFAVVMVVAFVAWMLLVPYVCQNDIIRRFGVSMSAVQVGVAALLAIVPFLTLCTFGRPAGSSSTEKSLLRIGFANDAGEVPRLVRRKKNKGVEVWEFDTCGLPLSRWQKQQDEVASALNRHIVSIYEGKDKRRIIVETVKPTKLSGSMAWDDAYISTEEFTLVLGKSHSGLVTNNLDTIPHMLLGGGTGSGKTVLMLGLIHQCKKKGATVYIADFKGGYDFPPDWKSKARFIADIEALRSCLENLVEELEARKLAMSQNDALASGGIGFPGQRIVFACDEIAEVLDKTGLTKEQKAIVAEIEGKLATIARLGRAFAINLIIGTQRPDAEVLSGQIKSNIGLRVCGRADDVLSRIILDNAEASRIPKDARGRFMLADGTEFQAFHYKV